MIPVVLDGLGADIELAGTPVRVVYRVAAAGSGPTALTLNGAVLPFEREENPYRLGGAVVPISVMTATFGFMLIYGAATMGLTFIMLLTGLDLVTAFSAVVATVNNIGPGLGLVGPSSNYGVLTEFQLWVLTFAMLLGRVELLSVLVLLTSQFWRK